MGIDFAMSKSEKFLSLNMCLRSLQHGYVYIYVSFSFGRGTVRLQPLIKAGKTSLSLSAPHEVRAGVGDGDVGHLAACTGCSGLVSLPNLRGI